MPSSTTPKTPHRRRAIWLNSQGSLDIITQEGIPQEDPDFVLQNPNQVLVSVRYSAINPADLFHFNMGMSDYVAGYEWIGEVVATYQGGGGGEDGGSSSSSSPPLAKSIVAADPATVKKGDVLFGAANWGHRRPMARGAHQDLVIAQLGPGSETYRAGPLLLKEEEEKEEEQSWKELVSLPIAVNTAAEALFNVMGFAFPPVGQGVVTGSDPKGRALLIWGGASVVGLITIQIAKAAGFHPIYTTASPRNHATLLDLGATACFDYRSPTVVDQIRHAVSSHGGHGGNNGRLTLTAIFDAVAAGTGFMDPRPDIDATKSSSALAKRCLVEVAVGDKKEEEAQEVVKLCATRGVPQDPDWTFCLARRDPTKEPIESARLDAVVHWALENRGTAARIPRVRTVKGAEEGIKAMHDVNDGKVSMEKVVIEHPM